MHRGHAFAADGGGVFGVVGCVVPGRCQATVGEVSSYDDAGCRHAETCYADVELEVGPVAERDVVA